MDQILRLGAVWPALANLDEAGRANAIAALIGRSQAEVERIRRALVAARWVAPTPPEWRPSRAWIPLLLVFAVWIVWKGWKDWRDPDGDGIIEDDCAPYDARGRAWFVDADGDGAPGSASWTCATAAPGPGTVSLSLRPPPSVDLCDSDAEVGARPVRLGRDRDGDGSPAPGAVWQDGCERPEGLVLADGPDGCGTGLDCSDADPRVHPGAPDETADGYDQDCDCVDGPRPPVTPASLVDPQRYAAVSRGALGAAGGLLLLGLLIGVGVETASRRFLRRSAARSRARLEALTGPHALRVELPLELPELPIAEVRAAVEGGSAPPDASTGRLDVRATVAATARQAGAPALRWQDRRTARELHVWIEDSPAMAPWRRRAEVLAEDLARLGAGGPVTRWAAGGWAERASGPPGQGALLVIGVGEALAAEGELARAWAAAHRRAWLHPAADPTLRPAGIDEVLPLDAGGLAVALARLAGARLPAPARPRLGERDRLRLIWLHGVAELTEPAQSARLLLEQAPATPESILLAAKGWLRPRDSEEAAERWTDAEATLRAVDDPLLGRAGAVRAAVGAALDAARPPAGSFAEAIWRRERATLDIGAGRVEQGLAALDALAADGLAALLSAGRQSPALDQAGPHARGRLRELWRAGRLARGAATPWSGVPAVIGGAALGLGLAALTLARPETPRVEQVYQLNVTPNGAVQAAGLGDAPFETLLLVKEASKDPRERAVTLPPSGQRATLDTLGPDTCAQLVDPGERGRLRVSNVACSSSSETYWGRLAVRVGTPPAHVEGLDLWLGCGDRWRAYEIWLRDPPADAPVLPASGEVLLGQPPCEYAAALVSWSGTAYRKYALTPSFTVRPGEATPLDVPADAWVNADASADSNGGFGWVKLLARAPDGPLSEARFTADYGAGRSSASLVGLSSAPVPPGRVALKTEDQALCGSAELSGGPRASPQVVETSLRPCDDRVAWFTVQLPEGVGLDEVFVRPMNGGQLLGIEGDRIAVSTAPEAVPPYDYNLEIGGSTRLWSDRPKAGVYYDETDWFEVKAGQTYAADLRGKPKIGVVELYVGSGVLGDYIKLEELVQQYGELDLSQASALSQRRRVWVSTIQGMLMIPSLSSEPQYRYSTAGRSVALDVSSRDTSLHEVTVEVPDCAGGRVKVTYVAVLIGMPVTSLDVKFDAFELTNLCKARYLADEASMAVGQAFTTDKLRKDVERLTCPPIADIDVVVRADAGAPGGTTDVGSPEADALGISLQSIEGVRITYNLTVSQAPGVSEELYAQLMAKYCGGAAPAEGAAPAAEGATNE